MKKRQIIKIIYTILLCAVLVSALCVVGSASSTDDSDNDSVTDSSSVTEEPRFDEPEPNHALWFIVAVFVILALGTVITVIVLLRPIVKNRDGLEKNK